MSKVYGPYGPEAENEDYENGPLKVQVPLEFLADLYALTHNVTQQAALNAFDSFEKSARSSAHEAKLNNEIEYINTLMERWGEVIGQYKKSDEFTRVMKRYHLVLNEREFE